MRCPCGYIFSCCACNRVRAHPPLKISALWSFCSNLALRLGSKRFSRPACTSKRLQTYRSLGMRIEITFS